MAKQRDEEEEEQDEEEVEKEERAELVKNLKATKQMFFAFIPKGTLGQLVVAVSKRERDQAAKETKSEIGGATPLMGTCSGSLSGKVFKLDREPPDPEKLSLAITRFVKLKAKLNIKPDIQLKSGPIEDEEEE